MMSNPLRDGHSLAETRHGAELVLSAALSHVASAYYGSAHSWHRPIYGSIIEPRIWTGCSSVASVKVVILSGSAVSPLQHQSFSSTFKAWLSIIFQLIQTLTYPWIQDAFISFKDPIQCNLINDLMNDLWCDLWYVFCPNILIKYLS